MYLRIIYSCICWIIKCFNALIVFFTRYQFRNMFQPTTHSIKGVFTDNRPFDGVITTTKPP